MELIHLFIFVFLATTITTNGYHKIIYAESGKESNYTKKKKRFLFALLLHLPSQQLKYA